MKRTGTVVVAVLAVLALAAAAGSYTTADQPALPGGDGPTSDGAEGSEPGASGDAPAVPSGEEGGEQVGDAPTGLEDAPESGGVSPLFVALFVGALLAIAVVAVLLTGDDDRARLPDDDGAGERGDPRPDVEVRYGSPPDNAVVRAWERLTDAVDARTTDTPGETARRAADRGFPADAVTRLRAQFSDVRYGGEPAEGRESEARDALDSLERRDEP